MEMVETQEKHQAGEHSHTAVCVCVCVTHTVAPSALTHAHTHIGGKDRMERKPNRLFYCTRFEETTASASAVL